LGEEFLRGVVDFLRGRQPKVLRDILRFGLMREPVEIVVLVAEVVGMVLDGGEDFLAAVLDSVVMGLWVDDGNCVVAGDFDVVVANCPRGFWRGGRYCRRLGGAMTK
jgi:hypothetical protein